MEIIGINRTADFNGSIRQYYNIHDVRILDVTSYAREERFHKHLKITEILFVLEGKIKVLTKTETKELLPNQVVVFKPHEYHKTEPITENSRVLAIKYIQKDDNLIPLISSDWEGA